MALTGSIDIDRALAGSDRNTSQKLDDFVRDHQFRLGDLKDAGKNSSDVAAYGAYVTQLANLRNSVLGNDSKIDASEREALATSMRAVEDAGTKAFKETESSSDSVTRGPTEYRDGASLDEVASSGKVLALGDRGEGVSEAQTLLRGIKNADGTPKYDLGAYGANGDGVDGKLGPKTAAALEQFKRDQGIEGSGTLDASTLTRLRSAGTSCNKPEDAPDDTRTAGPLTFRDGKLTVQGTEANEDVVVRRNGDDYDVDYARRGDRNEVVERQSLRIAAKDLTSAEIIGGGGTDRIWNGDGQRGAIDGAKIRTGADASLVTNHGRGADIRLGGKAFVDNFGADTAIVGSSRGDVIRNSGERARIDAGAFADVGNTGNDSRLRSAGYGNLLNVADGVTIDSRNGRDDRGVVLGNGNLANTDGTALDQGAFMSRVEAAWNGVDLRRARAEASPENTALPGDLKE
jgi:peptidoglycan hydrolase-like protein with peptidoglycan-binding domain